MQHSKIQKQESITRGNNRQIENIGNFHSDTPLKHQNRREKEVARTGDKAMQRNALNLDSK